MPAEIAKYLPITNASLHFNSYRIKSFTKILVWLSLFLAPSCFSQSIEDLVNQLDRIRADNQVAAYSIVITTPEKILIAENRGFTSLGSHEPISNDAYFRVGSITKSFIGLASLIAEQNQQLKLSDPVTQRIGANYFSNPWNQDSVVTLQQLLEHSAGFPDMSSRQEFNHNVEISNEKGLQLFAKDRKVEWQPGRFYSYSNTGYGLAGLAIEKASQHGINAYLFEQLFKPLNMPSATLLYTDNVKSKLVPGFDRDGRTPLPYWHLIFPAFGALNVQPKDMAHFIQLYLNRGKYNGQTIVSPENMTKAETPTTTLAAKNGIKYGYGLGIYNWFRQGHEFFGHGGDGDGYLARFGYSHKAQLGYFVVINRFQHKPLREMQIAVENWIIKDLQAPESIPRKTLSRQSKYLGNYRSVTGRFNQARKQTLEVFENNNMLFSRLGDNPSYELIPVGENHFRRRNDPIGTILIKEIDGEVIFSGDEGNFIKTSN